MPDEVVNGNPAEEASMRTLSAVFESLDQGRSFLVEAGAGAGKTYTLIRALQHLLARDRHKLPRRSQRIACITYTNVAKDEIEARTDHSPLIHCDTIHSFCWSVIQAFQPELRTGLASIKEWQELLKNVDDISDYTIEYALGYRKLGSENILIHHDDVIALTSILLEREKFRSVLAGRYPVILVDEYQDTNLQFVEAAKKYLLSGNTPVLLGFFGDHWQKIYGNGCGRIEHEALTVIDKPANFRSVPTIVECLNRMRPTLPQAVVDPNASGQVRIFHTNEWDGIRQTRNHWQGDLPDEQARRAFQYVVEVVEAGGWDLAPAKTKMLMLTHRILASHQGYGSIPTLFRYNESFTKKEHPHIAYFADVLEPACAAYQCQRYGEMFTILGNHASVVTGKSSKQNWIASMDRLIVLRSTGSVHDVVRHLVKTRCPRASSSMERLEKELAAYEPAEGEEKPRVLVELEKLHDLRYEEIVALSRYLAGHSPFETKHGVKGAEFENVLVVIGRGWNWYDFNEMLEYGNNIEDVPVDQKVKYERNRNLFYVACSRPRKRLAILFTQKLSEKAMSTVARWFGEEAIQSIEI